MDVVVIIFMIVASVFALGTLAYVIIDSIRESRSNKEPREPKEKKKKSKPKRKKSAS